MDRTYMQEYYSKNKERMLEKMLTKTQCQLCHRIVAQGFLKQHMHTSICSRNFDKLTKTDDIVALKNRIAELESELTNFKSNCG